MWIPSKNIYRMWLSLSVKAFLFLKGNSRTMARFSFLRTLSLVSRGAGRLCKLKPFGLIDQILPRNALGKTVFQNKTFWSVFALGVSFLWEPGFTDFHYPCLYFHLWCGAGQRARFSTDTEWICWLPETYHFIWKIHFKRNQFGKFWFRDEASGILEVLSSLLKL